MRSLAESSRVKKTLITSIEAQRLKGIATRLFFEFKRFFNLYAKEIEGKGRQLGEETTPTPYRASIEDGYLQIFIATGCTEASYIDEITERQVQQCMEERCKHKITR